MSRNVDTLSLSSVGGVQGNLGGSLQSVDATKLFNADINTGTKDISSKGCDRIQVIHLFSIHILDNLADTCFPQIALCKVALYSRRGHDSCCWPLTVLQDFLQYVPS